MLHVSRGRKKLNTGILWLVFMVAWILIMLWNSEGIASETMTSRADAAILWLVTPPETASEETIRRMSDCMAHNDHDYRQELSIAFVGASERFDIPLWHLLAIGYTESIFRHGVIGDGGRSHGIMQVGRQGRLACREYCQQMETVEQQVWCGACWLDKGRQWCGSLDSALAAYVGGHCRLRTAAAAKAHMKKQKVATKLEEKFGGEIQ